MVTISTLYLSILQSRSKASRCVWFWLMNSSRLCYILQLRLKYILAPCRKKKVRLNSYAKILWERRSKRKKTCMTLLWKLLLNVSPEASSAKLGKVASFFKDLPTFPNQHKRERRGEMKRAASSYSQEFPIACPYKIKSGISQKKRVKYFRTVQEKNNKMSQTEKDGGKTEEKYILHISQTMLTGGTGPL